MFAYLVEGPAQLAIARRRTKVKIKVKFRRRIIDRPAVDLQKVDAAADNRPQGPARGARPALQCIDHADSAGRGVVICLSGQKREPGEIFGVVLAMLTKYLSAVDLGRPPPGDAGPRNVSAIDGPAHA